MDISPSSSQPSFTTAQASSSNSIAPGAASASTAFSLATIPQSQPTSSTFNPASSAGFPPNLPQETTTTGTGSTLIDANAPELFKQNVQIAMEQVARVNALARSASNGIQNAYQAGVNPAQTKADLIMLDRALQTLADLLRQSGVGAFPLPESGTSPSGPPTEQQLLADTTRGVQQLYDEFKRMQESSAVVANLLAVQEGIGRPKA